MEENKKQRRITIGDLVIIMVSIFLASAIGFIGGFSKASNDLASVTANETYLYNLGYAQGHNDIISSFPEATNESVSQNELLSQIGEILSNADKIDLKVSGDKETGKAELNLSIEFSQ